MLATLSRWRSRVQIPSGTLERCSVAAWSSECDGIARDPPKVADQVRLLARTWHVLNEHPRGCGGCTSAFEADGPGSTPGRGASDARWLICLRSVTDSHTTLRRSETRFDSWRGRSQRNPNASAWHGRAILAVTQAPLGCGGSTPSRRTAIGTDINNGPFVYRTGPLVLSQVRRVRLPHGLLACVSKDFAEWRNGRRATSRWSCPR